MDRLKQLSPPTQAVLGASVLYFIFSFLDWQQVSIGPITAGVSEWDGIGVLAGLLVVGVLVWEGLRLGGIKLDLGSVTPGLISVVLALLLVLFTLITFLDHSTARHWPAWIGLILSVVIGAAAVVRAKAEGVTLPSTKQSN
jgi:hypothetical protein